MTLLMTFEGHFTNCECFSCMYLTNTAHIMYKVN